MHLIFNRINYFLFFPDCIPYSFPVNYPTLLTHGLRRSLPEGVVRTLRVLTANQKSATSGDGASCFDDALSIHYVNTS